MPKVVATGLGLITPIGAGIEEFEQRLYAGCSGLGPAPLAGECVEACEIREFTPQTWLGNKGIRVLDRAARLVCVSSQMALAATGLAVPEGVEGDPAKGLVLGTMFGSVRSITAFDYSGLIDGAQYVNPMEFPNTVINSPAGQAAIKFKLRGVNSTISAGVISGLYAIHYAAEFLRLRRAKALLAGGCEELCEESYLTFKKNGWVSERGKPEPFGKDRDGLVVGEGSALFMLETEDSAEARGVEPMVEVAGFGNAHDAHAVAEFRVRAEGAIEAIEQALEQAGVTAEDVGAIVASATGSRAGDAMEAHALRHVFGGRLKEIPVTAPKAALGEAMGASGALLAAVGALAAMRGSLAPTAGFTGSEYELKMSVDAQPLAGGAVLVNCFGCDGNNAAMVLRKG